MADEDDQWLYGDAPESESEKPQSNGETNKEESEHEADKVASEPQTDEIEAKSKTEDDREIPLPPGVDAPEKEASEDENQNGEQSEKGEDEEEDDDDDESDDDVNVVIGDIKTSPTYAPLNIKRGGLNTTLGDKTKMQPGQAGKFTVEEFEQLDMINGVPAGEFSLDSIEDKPWRKPGADITDYFNYGFNEDTWKAYCERQKRMRVGESGVGMMPLNAIGMPRGAIPIMNDNSKYSGGTFMGLRKAGPPPGRRMTGAIDVIGGSANKMDAPKENVIQVMTADRREYSRKPPGFPDMSMPPPPQSFDEFQPEFGFNPEPEPFYGGYEPTQDVQWGTGNTAGWAPNQIKSLTPGPVPPPPPPNIPMPVPPPQVMPPAAAIAPMPINDHESPPRRGESRERESHENHARPEKRERERERDRERSHRREARSRSRSRRHKSRSRSPTHRSHRKKKSRRHEDSD